MKIFASLCLLLALSTAGMAQKKGKSLELPEFPRDEKTNLVSYNEVVTETGDKTALYEKGKKWFNTYYKSPSSVIKKQDMEAGVISGRGRIKLWDIDPKTGERIKTGGIALYTITIQFKDGRYRYEITDIQWKQASTFPMKKWIDENEKKFNWQYANFLAQVDQEVKALIEDLKADMSVAAESAGEDW
ncbi:MAG: DUF4468 domain-containing protein [Salibacteraceae bacterium]